MRDDGQASTCDPGSWNRITLEDKPEVTLSELLRRAATNEDGYPVSYGVPSVLSYIRFERVNTKAKHDEYGVQSRQQRGRH